MLFFKLPANISGRIPLEFQNFANNVYQKSTQQGKLVRNFFKNWMRNSAGALVILVRLCFSSCLHYTCFSCAICPLQVPVVDFTTNRWVINVWISVAVSLSLVLYSLLHISCIQKKSNYLQ